jgi:hypothetical protein
VGGLVLVGASLVGGLDEVGGSVVDRELVRGEFVDGAGDDVVVAVAPSLWPGVSRFSPAVCSAGGQPGGTGAGDLRVPLGGLTGDAAVGDPMLLGSLRPSSSSGSAASASPSGGGS